MHSKVLLGSGLPEGHVLCRFYTVEVFNVFASHRAILVTDHINEYNIGLLKTDTCLSSALW